MWNPLRQHIHNKWVIYWTTYAGAEFGSLCSRDAPAALYDLRSTLKYKKYYFLCERCRPATARLPLWATCRTPSSYLTPACRVNRNSVEKPPRRASIIQPAGGQEARHQPPLWWTHLAASSPRQLLNASFSTNWRRIKLTWRSSELTTAEKFDWIMIAAKFRRHLCVQWTRLINIKKWKSFCRHPSI